MDVHDLTAAYALHALDDVERADYEAHLAQCEPCREELALLTESAAALAWAVESPAPPASLRARILDEAAAGRENVVPLRPRRPIWQGISAVAACAAIGLGIWATSLSHSLDRERAAQSATARAIQVYDDPQATRFPLHGASGVVAVEPTGQAVLVVRNMPAAPRDKTYVAWVMAPGAKPVRAGSFHGGDAMSMLPLSASVPVGSVVAATVEPSADVNTPSTRPVVTAQT